MVYIYPKKDLRAFPGAIRGTEEWIKTFKIRSVVEQSIILKIVFALLEDELKTKKHYMPICY